MDVFSAASELASADLKDVQTPAQVSDSTPSETPAPATVTSSPNAPTESAEPVHETPAEAAVRRELELTWKGQKVKLPEEEVVNLAQKGYDYSQKTAELSRYRAEIEAQRQQLNAQAAELQQVLSDPQQLRQLVQWAAEQNAPEVLDPTMGVTAQQAQQMIQSNLQQMQKQVQTDIKRAQLELETNRLEQEFTGSINQHLNQTLKKHPVLQDVEGIEKLLRQEALTYQQAKLAANPHAEVGLPEVLEVMAKAAERQATKIEARFKNMLKAQAVKQASVLQSGIDPGGSAPPPTANPIPKLGSKTLRDQVMADITAMMSQ